MMGFLLLGQGGGKNSQSMWMVFFLLGQGEKKFDKACGWAYFLRQGKGEGKQFKLNSHKAWDWLFHYQVKGEGGKKIHKAC
jgi:hypothetical protein